MNGVDERLSRYLDHLMAVCSDWSTWIADQEHAAVVGNYQRLDELTQASSGLLDELKGLQDQRAAILQEALAAGWKCASISELAQLLPSWTDPKQRERVRAARRQMEHLRRLHLAIWVLISQCERFASETMSLLSYGRLTSSVYLSNSNSDTGGGQLLDAQL